MLFMLIALGFVVVVTGCMILINRWMVSQRPKLDSTDEDRQESDEQTSSDVRHRSALQDRYGRSLSESPSPV